MEDLIGVATEFEYIPGRKIYRGDTIRVSQGPYFTDSKGRKISQGTKGRFVFHSHIQDAAGNSVIFVRDQGREQPIVIARGPNAVAHDNFTYRDYKITKERLKWPKR
jgi:hypothetical protein